MGKKIRFSSNTATAEEEPIPHLGLCWAMEALMTRTSGTLGKNYLLREVMSIISNSCNQIILPPDCFCAVSSAEWETSQPTLCLEPAAAQVHPAKERGGCHWQDDLDFNYWSGRVDLASEKLVTTLGSLVTWWALLFCGRWGVFGGWSGLVKSCVFLRLLWMWHIQSSALQSGKKQALHIWISFDHRQWKMVNNTVTAQSFIRPFRIRFQTSSKSPFLVQADLQEHKIFLFPKGFPPPA